MPVNPITGIVTYTLAEWEEERKLWERDGEIRAEQRIIALIEKTHKHGMTHSERCAIRHDFADYLIERIKRGNE